MLKECKINGPLHPDSESDEEDDNDNDDTPTTISLGTHSYSHIHLRQLKTADHSVWAESRASTMILYRPNFAHTN